MKIFLILAGMMIIAGTAWGQSYLTSDGNLVVPDPLSCDELLKPEIRTPFTPFVDDMGMRPPKECYQNEEGYSCNGEQLVFKDQKAHDKKIKDERELRIKKEHKTPICIMERNLNLECSEKDNGTIECISRRK